MMKKVLVTGANGFVGSAICKELVEQGVLVIAVVRDKKSNIDAIKKLSGLRIVCCEMDSYNRLPQLILDRDIDAFYHFAWIGSAGELRGDYDVQLDNVKYTCDAVEACASMNCKRFIFAGSIMEYEISATMENDSAPKRSTIYSAGKLSADYMARIVSCNVGVEYIRCIISNIYGPGETSPRLVNTTLRKLLSGEHCAFTAGNQMYDFIYISDAAKSFAVLGDKGRANRAYYIGSRNPRPLNKFLRDMRDCVNPEIVLGFGEIPFSGVPLTYNEFDLNAVWEDTGFSPTVEFKEGVCRTIRWLRGENDGV